MKVRRTLIGGAKQMVVYDDLEPSEMVKVYNKGITLSNSTEPEGIYQILVGYRTGDMWAPNWTNGSLKSRSHALPRLHQQWKATADGWIRRTPGCKDSRSGDAFR